MSADRYEITVDGPCVTIKEPCGFSGEYHRSEYADNVLYGAIRQQARDIAELRAELQMCCELKREYQERAAVAAEQADQLRADLAAAVAARANMDTDRLEWMTRAEQAEARLAAIDNAPTVAVVSECAAGLYVHQKLFGAQLAEPSAELIYRPTKDQA